MGAKVSDLSQVMKDSWPAIKALVLEGPGPKFSASGHGGEAITNFSNQPCVANPEKKSSVSHAPLIERQQSPQQARTKQSGEVVIRSQLDLEKASLGMAGAAESLFMARMMQP